MGVCISGLAIPVYYISLEEKMVFETTLQCVLEAGVGSIHGEASMERFATESSSDGSSFMIEDDLPFGEVSAVEDETNSSELSESTENGLLTLSLNEFVLNESPYAGRDSQEELNYGLSEFGLPNTTALECFELGLGECTQELSENKDLFNSDLFNPGKNDVSNIQSDQTEEVSMSKEDSLNLTDCLNSDRGFEKPDQTEIKVCRIVLARISNFMYLIIHIYIKSHLSKLESQWIFDLHDILVTKKQIIP